MHLDYLKHISLLKRIKTSSFGEDKLQFSQKRMLLKVIPGIYPEN